MKLREAYTELENRYETIPHDWDAPEEEEPITKWWRPHPEAIVMLCLRDKEENGIENDQSNTCNDYVRVHNQKRILVLQRLKR